MTQPFLKTRIGPFLGRPLPLCFSIELEDEYNTDYYALSHPGLVFKVRNLDIVPLNKDENVHRFPVRGDIFKNMSIVQK